MFSSKPAPKNVDVALAATIVKEAVKPECSVERIAELAKASPGFALRLLSAVNSAGLGGTNRITDVGRACAMLGLRRLRNLALSLVVSGMTPPGECGLFVLANSMRRAAAAESIAVALKVPDPDALFMTGLFLEIGLLALASERPDVATEVLMGPAKMRPLCERAMGEVPHPETGAAMADEFGLPDATLMAIHTHHDEQAPEDLTARIAWLAERVASVYEGGEPQLLKQNAIDSGLDVGLDEATMQRILEELPVKVTEAGLSLDRDLGEQPCLETLERDANRALIQMNESYETLVHRLEAVIAQKDKMAQELVSAASKLARLARTDDLTGLPNKRSLNEAIERELAHIERNGGFLSLIVIDVDHFKRFNDTWGHAVGDDVLRAVGAVLLESVRGGDMPARYGGEEFVVLLRGVDAKRATAAAERLRILLSRKTIQGPKGPLSVTASFGVATLTGPAPGSNAKVFFEQADAALYEAKRMGRNRVACAA